MPAYNPTEFISSWAGIPIQGEMDGEFLDAAMTEDQTTLHKGAKGFGTFVHSANNSGTVKITLSQESPTNALLTAAAKTRKIGPWLSRSLVSATTITGAEAAIKKVADLKRGDKVIGVQWEFAVNELEIVHGGAP